MRMVALRLASLWRDIARAKCRNLNEAPEQPDNKTNQGYKDYNNNTNSNNSNSDGDGNNNNNSNNDK